MTLPQPRPLTVLPSAVISWINGEPATALPLDDRAIHYGDGAFRTLRVWDGQVDDLAGQLDVLNQACSALQIPFDTNAAARELDRAASSIRRGVLKLIVSRGSASSRGYRPAENVESRRILLSSALPHGLPTSAVLLQEPHAVAAAPVRLQGKHLNRLPQVLAQQAAAAHGTDEAILCNQHGHVACASSANVFIADADGTIATPPTSDGALPGRMRARLIDMAGNAGIDIAEAHLSADCLGPQSCIILSNSVRGAWALESLQIAGRVVSLQPMPDSIRAIAERLSLPTANSGTDTPNLRP